MPESPSQWPLLHRLFAGLLRKAFGGRLIRLHKEFFAWHCESFFPFDRHLSEAELAYLETCFELAELLPEMPHDSGYEEYSYFSYSHRVEGAHTNSSRLAYGSLSHPTATLEAALPVLEERGLSLPGFLLDDPGSIFYGLGWDLLAGHFKVYFRILDLTGLPLEDLRPMLEAHFDPQLHRKEGLISYTYIEGGLHEKKVYIYPKPEVGAFEELFPGTKGRVLMVTSQRGVQTQYDVSAPKHWEQKLNQAGKEILEKYRGQGYSLDTIAIKDRDHFTLYFPGVFNPLRHRMG